MCPCYRCDNEFRSIGYRSEARGHTAHDNDTKKNRSPIKFTLVVTLLRIVAV